ncbi:hypothetical protein AWC38_SpisGene6710 [Stylophora pistillata]|uniref:C-type lectin domain-containing protein n=1 Tax=Stylophora pistillata TaxID=50429 RepID=A0A2B4SFD8_STYPI|nr:hypothetical protein AWC38_SpisGene6710 [Stylophora pistillata]
MDQGVIRALKAHYRSKAAQMYITAIENNRRIPNISILVAMDMLVAAWDKVTQGTINNCFRATGISHQSQESALSDDDDDPFMTLAEEINNLRERAPELAPENVTAGIVVKCDDGAATFEADPLTDEDILAEFNHSADLNEEEEEELDEDEIVIVDEPPKPPTQCELRHAIGVLNTFSFFADDTHLDNLRKKSKRSCYPGWKAVGSTCLRFFGDTRRTWDGARAYCRPLGGDLALPKISEPFSTALPKLLKLLTNVETDFYVGFHRSRPSVGAEKWIWNDGETVDRQQFKRGYPLNGEENPCGALMNVIKYEADSEGVFEGNGLVTAADHSQFFYPLFQRDGGARKLIITLTRKIWVFSTTIDMFISCCDQHIKSTKLLVSDGNMFYSKCEENAMVNLPPTTFVFRCTPPRSGTHVLLEFHGQQWNPLSSRVTLSGFASYKYCCQGMYCPDCPLLLEFHAFGNKYLVNPSVKLTCSENMFEKETDVIAQPALLQGVMAVVSQGISEKVTLLSPWNNRSADKYGGCLKLRFLMFGPGAKGLEIHQQLETNQWHIWKDSENTMPYWRRGQVSLSSLARSKIIQEKQHVDLHFFALKKFL